MNPDINVQHIECDQIEAKSFVLKDNGGNERASLYCTENKDGDCISTVLHFYDEQANPRLSIQIDQVGNPTISLFNPGNSPGVSIGVDFERGNGITVSSVNGIPLVSIGVHGKAGQALEGKSEFSISGMDQEHHWGVVDGQVKSK